MKKITLAFLLLASSVGMFAQEEQQIYFTTFQAAPNSPVGWTKEMVSGDEGETLSNWYYGETVLPLSSSFSAPAAVFNDDANLSEEANTARIISRVFDISQYNTVSMEFEYGLSGAQGSGTLKAEVFNGVEWIVVMNISQDTPPTMSYPIELDIYKNPLFQVRFTFSDGGALSSLGGAGITNFRLFGTIDVAPNDFIDNAISLYCGDNMAGTNALSTPDSGVFSCGGGSPANSNGVWYKYDAPEQQGPVTFSLCDSGTDFTSHINVFKGYTDELECVENGISYENCGNLSSVSFDYNGTVPYYILVTGQGVTTGNYTVKLICGSAPPPNDDIINAIDVDQFPQPYTDPSVALKNATPELGYEAFETGGCVQGDWYPHVFYKFTATSDGTATVSMGTPNPGNLTYLTFFTAPNEQATIADLTWVNQISNQCNFAGYDRTINTLAGTTYYITVMQPDTNSDVNINISSSLSAGDHTIEGFSYSPNPVSTALQLNSRNIIEQITVYNLLGQNVKEYAPNALNATIDMSSIAAGTYIMKALVNGTTGTYKIIKQ